MGLSKEEAIVVGSRFRTELLVEWALQLAQTARKDFHILARRGLSEGMLRQFEKLADQVGRLEAGQEMQKKAGMADTALSFAAQDEALGWWREVRQTVKVEFGADPDRIAEFRTGVKVGRSIPRLMRELEFLILALERRKENLAWLGVAGLVSRGRELLERLKQAEAQQESARKQLPRDTAELCWTKGELYDLGRKIARIAKLAFMASPAQAAAYNFDILRRGHAPAKSGVARKA